MRDLTAAEKLRRQRFCAKNFRSRKKVTKLEFPNYESPAAAPVKMYLDGEFGDKPDDVNAYAASAFYAVDRVASYLQFGKGM